MSQSRTRPETRRGAEAGDARSALTPHLLSCRVYYEDTDLQGVVYYANYLRYIERGRTEMLTALGIDQTDLLKRWGIVFMVRRVEADYLQPAKFGDDLTVATAIDSIRPASLIMEQEIRRHAARLFIAKVSVVAIDRDGRPTRLPAELRAAVA